MLHIVYYCYSDYGVPHVQTNAKVESKVSVLFSVEFCHLCSFVISNLHVSIKCLH